MTTIEETRVDAAASSAHIRGLSEQEVLERRSKGMGNNVKISTSRSYADIVRSNLLNLINLILFVIGALMIMIGRVGDAVTSVGLIFFNVVIGIYQEIRAKRQLDQIALLTRPQATVIRDGEEKVVDPTELVIGDIIVVQAGDQIVVDGRIVGDGRVDVDESLLTGESDLIKKAEGDEVLSGSFCVSGKALYEAVRVGEESFANKLTANARQFQMAMTPLQAEINFILRLLMLLALFLGALMVFGAVLQQIPFMRQVQMAAVIAGLIPNGLLAMVILAYAMGALRIVQQGALVQQANAVESLSNVTVLCMDKTGTLTANRIKYDCLYPIGIDEARAQQLLGDFASSASSTNKTGEAIMEGIGGTRRDFVDEIPFSSALKWSAIICDDEDMRGVYVLGALEMLSSYLELPEDAAKQLSDWSDQGLRVLIFAYHPEIVDVRDAEGKPTLPQLTPLALVCLSDELRPHLRETLADFVDSGITLKVISGDNPATVAALAKQAGLPGDLRYMSGPELEKLDGTAFEQAAMDTTVFGRITPDQKERLVDALMAQGHYVAMIGDGVNDVLSLKKANMGIAMQSGSSATRSVADMILLNDSFGVLPAAFTEGQRIVNGMKDIMRLFLTRVLYSALLIISTAVMGLGFPYLPKQNVMLIFLTVGFPTLALAIWARPGQRRARSILQEVGHFVLPAAFSITLFGLIVYAVGFFGGIVNMLEVAITPDDIAYFQAYTGIDYGILSPEQYILEVAHLSAQSALAAFLTLAGLVLVAFVEPPAQFFVGGDEYSGDWRPTLLAGLMLLAFVVIVLVEPFRQFFELLLLPWYAYGAIVLVTLVWMLLLRAAWRGRWMQRFLQLDRSHPAARRA
jgi:cation-transporting P-type ATPase E